MIIQSSINTGMCVGFTENNVFPFMSHLPSPSLLARLFSFFLPNINHITFGGPLRKGLSVIASHFVPDDGLCDRLYKPVLLKTLEFLSKCCFLFIFLPTC